MSLDTGVKSIAVEVGFRKFFDTDVDTLTLAPLTDPSDKRQLVYISRFDRQCKTISVSPINVLNSETWLVPSNVDLFVREKLIAYVQTKDNVWFNMHKRFVKYVFEMAENPDWTLRFEVDDKVVRSCKIDEVSLMIDKPEDAYELLPQKIIEELQQNNENPSDRFVEFATYERTYLEFVDQVQKDFAAATAASSSPDEPSMVPAAHSSSGSSSTDGASSSGEGLPLVNGLERKDLTGQLVDEDPLSSPSDLQESRPTPSPAPEVSLGPKKRKFVPIPNPPPFVRKEGLRGCSIQ